MDAGCPQGQVECWRVDLVGDPARLVAALRGCDAVVNLVGVKTARGQGFAAAHVEGVTRLIAACEAAGVRRLVHVSVAGARADRRPYLDSKWRGEQAVMGSGLAWTIVRPGVIHGVGDDFVTQLVAMLRHAAVFPAPGGGAALLQPVAVEDVALAIAAALRRPETAGQGFDVVGPEALPMRAWVRRVAEALGLRVWLVALPTAALAPVVRLLERVLATPPLTRAQLGLLSEGVVGSLAETRALLGAEPRALTPGRVAALAEGVGPWLGVSLRLVADERGREFLRGCGASAGRLLWLVPLAALLIAGLRAVTPDIWRCMLLANLVLIPAALFGLRLPWRALLRPGLSYMLVGTAAAALLYGLAWLAALGLRAVPGAAGQLAALNLWGELLPLWQALPILLLVVFGEELFWRAGVALPVAARLGPWWGCAASALAFTLAHLRVGPPLLWLAAFGCGFVWAWMVVRWRSVVPGLVCHALWDVAVVFVAPL
ncbi:MAG: NAD(P)H-binding protein [Nannocystis sp.]|uniref:NAD(P)H-binding protein n=1 Tax=Nannocystis sp. TaxID=1962667 RepID=UPI0024230594|nr:NAD(P)H-binding protein [Nannocystis sp.]MBK9757194.1 NAD(P)H-binding protein [Nannocystis sp.]